MLGYCLCVVLRYLKLLMIRGRPCDYERVSGVNLHVSTFETCLILAAFCARSTKTRFGSFDKPFPIESRQVLGLFFIISDTSLLSIVQRRLYYPFLYLYSIFERNLLRVAVPITKCSLVWFVLNDSSMKNPV